MKLQDLRYLVAIAEHRHFGRAAEACFVSQPTLSTQLRKLERELGVELVERSSRHVLLTATGERIAERARTVLREADAIGEIARHARDPEASSIRIGLFPTLGPYLLPHVVPAVHARYPRLELLLVEEKTEAVLAQLRSGVLDAGVLAMPVDDESLHEEPLFTEDFVFAVPDDHPCAFSSTVDVSVLEGESVLLLDDGHCLREQALGVCSLAGASERAGFRATSLETLRQMVAAGVGVTLLPRLAVEPPVAPARGVRIVEFHSPRPSRRIAMYWRRTSVYREFLPQLADVFRRLPDGLVAPLAP
jgi:LysR family hydrogen peroxide-inducible transcriptional activator